MKATSKGEIELRRSKVWSLKLVGMPIQKIANELKVHRGTISRDLRVLENEKIKEIKEDREKISARALKGLESTAGEMWKIVKTSSRPGLRIRAAAQLTSIYDKILMVSGIKNYQSNTLIQQQIGTVVTWESLSKVLEEGAKHRYELLERPAKADEQRRDEATS